MRKLRQMALVFVSIFLVETAVARERAAPIEKAPPLLVLCQRLYAQQVDVWPHGSARLLAINASLRGKPVENWDGWVAQIRCPGASCEVSFYGDDPYVPVSIPPPTPILDELLGPGVGVTRYPYLTALGVPAATAKTLRIGQHVRIAATLVEIGYSTGIDITLSRAEFSPLPGAAPAAADESSLPADEDMQITLHRGPCYGSCPIYELTVDGDGTVTFYGERFVAAGAVGMHKSRITAAQRKALFDAFVQAEFFSLQDRYQRPAITDQPSITLSFRRGAVRKTIYHSFGDLTAPVKLLLLEDQVDEIVGTRRFLPAR